MKVEIRESCMSNGKGDGSGTVGAAWDGRGGLEGAEAALGRPLTMKERRAMFDQQVTQPEILTAGAVLKEKAEPPFIPTPGTSPVTPSDPVLYQASGVAKKPWEPASTPDDELTLVAEASGYLRREWTKPVVPAQVEPVVNPVIDTKVVEKEPEVKEWTVEGRHTRFFGSKKIEDVVPDPASITSPEEFAKVVEKSLKHTVAPNGSDYALIIRTTGGAGGSDADRVQRNAIMASVKGIDFATLPDENKRELVAMCQASIAENFFARPLSEGRVRTDHPISQQDALAPGRDSRFQSEVRHVGLLQAGAELAKSCAAIDGKTLRIDGKLTDEKVNAALVEVGEKPMTSRQTERSGVVGAALSGGESKFQEQQKVEERKPKNREAAPDTLTPGGQGRGGGRY